MRILYREPLDFVNFEGFQSGPDLSDRKEGNIAAILPTNDHSKVGRYDGPKNSQNLTVLGISCLFLISTLCALDPYQETLYPSWRQTFEVTQMVYQGKTDYCEVAIFDNPTFGRVLAIDGAIQTTEKDEFIYHEMLVHPALLAHGKPLSVLIIGGGDGGALREVLRHKDVEKIVMVEIDQGIIDLTKQYMPTLSNGAFDDPRVHLIIQDASVYIRTSQELFDVILCDSCDPVGPSEILFTKEFYGDCKNHLNPGGILVNQNGSPFMQKSALKRSIANRKAHFDHVTFYLAPVPTYVGGSLAFGWASDMPHSVPMEILKKRLAKVSGRMKYYTPAIQKSSFALPQFMLPAEKKPKDKPPGIEKK